MENQLNRNRLFYGSCFALITTALTFAISAGVLKQLGVEFELTKGQLGFTRSMWFLGFPISMILGGIFYNTIGPKKIMQVAFFAHTIGIILTVYASGFASLMIASLLIGFGNGCTEAACNPMIADSYSGVKMNKMLNRFHMWFPGGIVIGSLVSKYMTEANMGWQAQTWLLLVPTVIYAILFFGQSFPKPKIEGAASLIQNLKAMVTPLYIFIFVAMTLTAISEFGPQQWSGLILEKSGASPMLILALVTGLMAVMRFFAGPVVKALDQTGVLLGGAVFATIGIYLLSTQTGAMAYVAAVFFAIGVAYFWPVMVGVVAQRVPLSGALGMSILGGVGMFSSAIFQPIIGNWIDNSTHEIAPMVGLDNTIIQKGKLLANDHLEGTKLDDTIVKFEELERSVGNENISLKELPDLDSDPELLESILARVQELDLAVGQETLLTMVTFPGILILLFLFLYIWQRKKNPVTETV